MQFVQSRKAKQTAQEPDSQAALCRTGAAFSANARNSGNGESGNADKPQTDGGKGRESLG